MSEGRIKRRWIEYNLLGAGKSRSPLEGAKYSYRDDVLFIYGRPGGRLIKLADGNFVNIYNGDGWTNSGNRSAFLPEGAPKLVNAIYVHCVGVFTRFTIDVLSVADTHERIRTLFFAEASELVEKVETTSAGDLVEGRTYYGSRGGRYINDIASLKKRYDEYNKTFSLGWREFPGHYVETIERVVEQRTEKYNSPAEVAKRDRKLARAEAREALGLNNKEKRK